MFLYVNIIFLHAQKIYYDIINEIVFILSRL